MSKHYILREKLREELESGAYPVGTQLPPAGVAASRYGVSKNCYLKAVKLLCNEGFVSAGVGRGTFSLVNGVHNNGSDEEEQVYNDLNLKITNNIFKYGTWLGSTERTAILLGCKPEIVNKCLPRLEAEGKIKKKHADNYIVCYRRRKTGSEKILILLKDDDHSAPYLLSGINSVLTETENITTLRIKKNLDIVRKTINEQHFDAIFFDGDLGETLDKIGCGSLNQTAFYSLGPAENLADTVTGGEVVSDWFHGGYIGIRHLIETGKRNIRVVVFNAEEKKNRVPFNFEEGCLAAKDDTLTDVKVTFFAESQKMRYMDAIEEDFHQNHYDAIFCISDFKLIKIAEWLADRKISIPGNVGLLGYHDTPWCKEFNPNLSSIATGMEEIGRIAAELYLNNSTETVIVKPKLMARESTVAAIQTKN